MEIREWIHLILYRQTKIVLLPWISPCPLLSVCILQDLTENSSVITPVTLQHKLTEVKDGVSST